MIAQMKAHVPFAVVMLISASITFGILWTRDIVHSTESVKGAETLPPAARIDDAEIERILGTGDSIDPDALEDDLRSIEMHAIGEGLNNIQLLLGTQ